MAQSLKNPPATQETACNSADLGSIPSSGSSPGEGNGTHSSILAWEISWMEEPGRREYSP